ncbi:MAG TPA: alpha/beta hydrolase family protein [Chitinophagaceae bacterium]|nr:alpha/beta hydrolase family protein [Chitinophagaceae bacterium]
MRYLSFFILVLVFNLAGKAAIVDSVTIRSKAMNKDYKAVVIVPDNYKNDFGAYPVVYLLHGYGGWFSNWITRMPQLSGFADRYNLIIVCPEGKNAWYIDSPVDNDSKFETYIGVEVPAYIDSHYNTIKDRTGRAITGFSMGGHGGLYLGFRHSDIFGACGSMSGGVDLRPFPKNWQLPKLLGDSAKKPANWKEYSVTTIIENKPKDSLAIIMDCGTEDFFYDVNKELHAKMLKLKIAHEYIERPGKHDWDYWKNAVQYQLFFFSNYFRREFIKSRR